MNESLPLLDTIIENLKKLTSSIIIKYHKEALNSETVETQRNYDYYYLACFERDKFSTYSSFTEEVLISANIIGKELEECLKDKNNIPENKRDRVMKIQRQYIIKNFEEKNDYYRKFVGLPPINEPEQNFKYVPTEIGEYLGIPSDIPIHKLDDAQLTMLSGLGYIKELIDANPNETYLNYLGLSRLDLHKIREAGNFSILKINKGNVPDKLYEEFMTCYEQSRTYFANAVYIKEYAEFYDFYENVIGFLIMINSIKMVMTKIFKNGIDRDFYDLYSIIKMFDAYNMPYIKEFNLEQQRIILRNINKLFRLKSTDKAIVELCTLLGLGQIDVYKYYLTKHHRRDINGKPVFLTKKNRLGVEVLDKENMYDVKFSKVKYGEKNIGQALNMSKNFLKYNAVTADDPYWWEDDQLKDAIFQTEFNFIETKYISFELMYKMTKVIFEQVYFLSLLHDRKLETIFIPISLPKVDSEKEISMFDACILLFALLCKKNNLKGEILSLPTQIGAVLGFNFGKSLGPIIENIKNDKSINDPELIYYITAMNLKDANDVNKLYSKIKGFREYIEKKLMTTRDKEKYYKYKQIYNIFMTTDTMSDLFILPDGEKPKTYKEFLQNTNYELYELVDTIDPNAISEVVSHILNKFKEYCNQLEYIHLMDINIQGTLNAIWSLINFFKSYTVDIHQFNIVYLIDGRMDNLIKILDTMRIHSELWINDGLDDEMIYDTLFTESETQEKDLLTLTAQSKYHVYMKFKDDLYVKCLGKDDVKMIAHIHKNEDWNIFDSPKLFETNNKINDYPILNEVYKYHSALTEKEYIYMNEWYKYEMSLCGFQNLLLTDSLKGEVFNLNYESLPLYDLYKFNTVIKERDYANPFEEVKFNVEIKARIDSELYDMAHLSNSYMNYREQLEMLEVNKAEVMMRQRDWITLFDNFKYENEIQIDELLSYQDSIKCFDTYSKYYDKLVNRDNVDFFTQFNLEDYVDFKETLKLETDAHLGTYLTTKDTLKNWAVETSAGENIRYKDTLDYIFYINNDDKIKFLEKTKYETMSNHRDYQISIDTVKYVDSNFYSVDKLRAHDKLEWDLYNEVEDKFRTIDKFSYQLDNFSSHKLELIEGIKSNSGFSQIELIKSKDNLDWFINQNLDSKIEFPTSKVFKLDLDVIDEFSNSDCISSDSIIKEKDLTLSKDTMSKECEYFSKDKFCVYDKLTLDDFYEMKNDIQFMETLKSNNNNINKSKIILKDCVRIEYDE